MQGHAWWPFWPLQHFSLGRAIQPDRTVQGHLFRAALLQNPTSKPSVLTECNHSKQLPCTQQCNGHSNLYVSPWILTGLKKCLSIILHWVLKGKGAHLVTLSWRVLTYRRYRWERRFFQHQLALFFSYWNTPSLPVSGEARLPFSLPRVKRKTHR